MGAWGATLYADDTTCEVRDAYVENLRHGLSEEEAYEHVLQGYGDLLNDLEVACLVYFALADTAWKLGRLPQSVKVRALELIKQGGDLFVWERDAPEEVAVRRRTLRSLEARLLSEQPASKLIKLSKPKPKKIRTNAPVGSVFLMNLPSGYTAVFVLVGFIELGKSIDPVFSVLNWRGYATQVQLGMTTHDTLSFSSGLGENLHIGLFPTDERKNVMANLVASKHFALETMPFDISSVVFKNVEAIADEIDAHFGASAP
jgi:hypothetical protein